jgi:hypothetical protein
MAMEAPGDPAPATAATEPSAPAPAIAAPARRERTWPAVLALYLAAPIIAEMISGSTPPLAWLNPFNPIVQPALYGSGAILARELVRRRGLGWGNLLVLGAAYGILEEAIAVQTWFNFTPRSPSASLGTFGRFFETNWVWAFELSAYHAVISITIPVMLVEILTPRVAHQPWLRRRGVIGFAVVLALVTIFLALASGFVFFAKDGYTHPPLAPYLVAAALMVGVFWLGLRLRIPEPRPSARRAPGLWTVRLTVFGVVLLFYAVALILPKSVVPAPLVVAAGAAILALGLWRVRSWAARQGWGARHRLAIVTGALAFLCLVFAPLTEFAALRGQPQRAGSTLVDLVFLGCLFVLDWRLRRKGTL